MQGGVCRCTHHTARSRFAGAASASTLSDFQRRKCAAFDLCGIVLGLARERDSSKKDKSQEAQRLHSVRSRRKKGDKRKGQQQRDAEWNQTEFK